MNILKARNQKTYGEHIQSPTVREITGRKRICLGVLSFWVIGNMGQLASSYSAVESSRVTDERWHTWCALLQMHDERGSQDGEQCNAYSEQGDEDGRKFHYNCIKSFLSRESVWNVPDVGLGVVDLETGSKDGTTSMRLLL